MNLRKLSVGSRLLYYSGATPESSYGHHRDRLGDETVMVIEIGGRAWNAQWRGIECPTCHRGVGHLRSFP